MVRKKLEELKSKVTEPLKSYGIGVAAITRKDIEREALTLTVGLGRYRISRDVFGVLTFKEIAESVLDAHKRTQD